MINISCDGCYMNIKEELLSQPGEIVTLSLETTGISSARLQSKVKTLHLCKKCKTTKRGFYLDNPFFVEPPEDAKSEQKASQGS